MLGCHSERPKGAKNLLLFLKCREKQILRFAQDDTPRDYCVKTAPPSKQYLCNRFYTEKRNACLSDRRRRALPSRPRAAQNRFVQVRPEAHAGAVRGLGFAAHEVSIGADRGHQRQGVDGRYAGLHPARRGIPDGALHFSAPGAHQRANSYRWRRHQRRRLRRRLRMRTRGGGGAGR